MAESTCAARCLHVTTPAQPSVADLVTQYATRFNAEFTTRHTVSSPLGLWLLLALTAPATTGTARAALGEILGTDPDTAATLAGDLLADPHPDVAAAVAAWSSAALTAEFTEFAATLPSQVEQGPIPSQGVADAWAASHTREMIKKFPIDLTPDTVLVLASALATELTWVTKLRTVDASHLAGPFGRDLAATGANALVAPDATLWDTAAAGRVAVCSPDSQGLGVLSVIAEPSVPAEQVHEAAHQVAAALLAPTSDTTAAAQARRVDLFDVELGEGHAWTLTEKVVRRTGHGRASEGQAFLPAWEASTTHDLLGRAPGLAEALTGLFSFVRPEDCPPSADAKQSAVAEYTATGFKAAAVTAVGVLRAASIISPGEVTVRTVTARFNRPHAVLAVVTEPTQSAAMPGPGRGATSSVFSVQTRSRSRPGAVGAAWVGVPVFSAWVERPAPA